LNRPGFREGYWVSDGGFRDRLERSEFFMRDANAYVAASFGLSV